MYLPSVSVYSVWVSRLLKVASTVLAALRTAASGELAGLVFAASTGFGTGHGGGVGGSWMVWAVLFAAGVVERGCGAWRNAVGEFVASFDNGIGCAVTRPCVVAGTMLGTSRCCPVIGRSVK